MQDMPSTAQLPNGHTQNFSLCICIYLISELQDIIDIWTHLFLYMNTSGDRERKTERERYRIRQGSTYLVQGVCVARGVF